VHFNILSAVDTLTRSTYVKQKKPTTTNM